MEAGIHEKKDAAELVLDGHLFGENPEEVNLAELLRIEQCEFEEVKTIDEEELEQGWPHLRAALGKAFTKWKGERPAKQAHVTNLPLWHQRFLRIG